MKVVDGLQLPIKALIKLFGTCETSCDVPQSLRTPKENGQNIIQGQLRFMNHVGVN